MVKGLAIACALIARSGAAARASDVDVDPFVHVDVAGPLPFTEAELNAAIAARLAFSGRQDRRLRVTVGPGPEGAVLVRHGDDVRSIDIGDRLGGAAARVVALDIVDLQLGTLQPPPAPAALVSSRARRTALVTSVLGGVAKGSEDNEPLTGSVALDLTVPVIGRLRASLGLAWLLTPDQGPSFPSSVSFAAWTVRASAGLDLGPLEVFGGAFLTPYSLTGPNHDENGLLGGLGAWTRTRVRITGGLSGTAAVGFDVFVNRTEITTDSGTVFESPRVSFNVGAGLAYEIGL